MNEKETIDDVIVEEVTPLSNNETTVTNVEVKETIIETPVEDVIKDQDGSLVTLVDEAIIDTSDMNTVYKAKFKASDSYINKPYINKSTGVLFGKSPLTIPSNNVEESDIADDMMNMLSEFNYMGEYIDVYLPTSNQCVRIYEFDNTAFFDQAISYLQRDFSDIINSENVLTTTQKPVVSTQILDIIKKNCEFLCSDSKMIDISTCIDSLAKSDINVLILGAIALLHYRLNDKKNYIYSRNDDLCTNCKAKISYDIDLLDTLKSIYDKSGLTEDEYKKEILAYNINETWMDKLNRSKFAKSYKTKYTKDAAVNGQGKTMNITVHMKMPSLRASKEVESVIYNEILTRYPKLVNQYSLNIPGYHLMDSQRKIVNIIKAINEDSDISELRPIYTSFMSDYIITFWLPFITKIQMDSTITGTDGEPKVKSKTAVFSDLSPDKKLDMCKSLPAQLVERIGKIRNKLYTDGAELIHIGLECTKCNSDISYDIDPLVLFFILVDNILTLSESKH